MKGTNFRLQFSPLPGGDGGNRFNEEPQHGM